MDGPQNTHPISFTDHVPNGRELRLQVGPDSLGTDFVDRAEALMNGEISGLVEAILAAHLLLEQALTLRIARKMERPASLTKARLSFAQLISLYDALYAPDPQDVTHLRHFNSLRNQIAHTLGNAEQKVKDVLGELEGLHDADAAHQVRLMFFYLFFGELIGAQGAYHASFAERQQTFDHNSSSP